MPARRANATLVGIFVLAAFLLGIGGLLFLGAGDWFAEKRRFVIYFGNAIKGLSVGAPVTFKGVPVGRVVGLKVQYVKETGMTEIPVIIEIDPAKMVTPGDNLTLPGKLLQQMIGQGLRAQINPESLITNQQVVQLDFFPGTPARLVESRLPYPQIPSLPSTFEQLQASLGNAAQNLPELANAATTALNQLSSTLSAENQQKLSHILGNIDQVTGNLAAHGADLGKTLASLQRASEELDLLLHTINQTLAENRQPLGQMLVNVGQTTDSLRKLSDALTAILAENREGVADFANGGLYDLAGLIADSRTLVRRATDTLEQLNRDPARFLFGKNDQGIPAK